MTQARIRCSTNARQNEIVRTVLKLSAERSPGLITTQEIADAIGVTQGAIFRHFPSKAAIWLAVIGWVEENLLPALAAAATRASGPEDGLRQVFFAHVDFVIANPGVPRLIFHELQEANDSPVKLGVRRILIGYRKLLDGLLAATGKLDEFDPSLDIDAAAMLFIGTVQGLVMQSMLSGQEADMHLAARKIFPLYLRSLRSPA